MQIDIGYWLSPKGDSYAVRLGGHMEKGFDLCEKYYFSECFYEIGNTGTYMSKTGLDAVYFLEEKNWLRYQGWGDVKWIIRSTHRPTKRQINKMYELTKFNYYDTSRD